MLENSSEILNLISDGFFCLDAQLRFTHANPVTLSYFKLPLDKVIGRHLDDFSPSIEERNKFRDRYFKVLETGEPIEFSESYDGLHLRINAYRTANGQLVVFFSDITKVKEAELKMKAAYELAEEAVRMRDEFMSIASHELKTPLTSLQLQTQMNEKLVEYANLDPETSQRLLKSFEKSRLNIGRLSRLVEDMLDISILAHGKLTLQKENFVFNNMLKDVIERMHPHFAENQLHTDLAIDIKGYWDRFRLEQVVQNLLSNAVKYGEKSPIHISLNKEGESAVLSVRDHGPGISHINHQRIFDRFVRVKERSNTKGMGLGLYICREIVHMHGGTIEINSSLGQGAEFIVKLPVS